MTPLHSTLLVFAVLLSSTSRGRNDFCWPFANSSPLSLSMSMANDRDKGKQNVIVTKKKKIVTSGEAAFSRKEERKSQLRLIAPFSRKEEKKSQLRLIATFFA